MKLQKLPSFSALTTLFQNPVALLVGLSLCLASALASAQGPVNFGSINVCPSSATTPAPCSYKLPLTFNIPAGTTIGTISYLTVGAQNLDFKAEANDTSTGLCSPQTYSSATTCTVDVTFAPLYAGERYGAVQLLDSSGNVLITTLIEGSGVAPLLNFLPGTESVIDVGDMVNGLAVDGSGNVYLGDWGNGRVLKETPSENTYTETTIASGLRNPAGAAVDGAGNIYVTTWTGDQVLKETWSEGGYLQSSIGSGLSAPSGVAVDGSGNVYIADSLNGRVLKETPSAGSYAQTDIFDCGTPGYQSCPGGVAVDASGNLYITGYLLDYVVKLTALADGYSKSTIGSGLFWPGIIVVDGSGNLYIADTLNSRVVKETLSDGSYIQSTVASSPLYWPWGVAVDQKGNIFITDSYHNRVLKEDTFDPPSLNFATTQEDSISVENIGNATLSLSGLSVSENFTQVPGSGTPADCTASSSLTPGGRCNLSISFTPDVEGPLTGTVTLSDNALNGNPATQIIPLQGDGPVAQVSTTWMQFATIPFGGSSETLPLTVTNVGQSTLTIASSINGPSYKIASSTCGGGVTAGNSCILQVEFFPVAVGGHGDILTLQTNGLVNPTVTLHGIASGVGPEMETPLQFGTIPSGTTEVLLLTINNIGVAGTVTIGTQVNGPSYKILTNSQNTCLAGVTAGHSCTLPVEFDPVAVGNHDDHLNLTPSGGAAPSTVYLHGVAD